MILREPVGVVGLVLPWNFPLLMLAWKIGPALAAGCSVIVKPAEETSLTALRVAELAMEAGVPPGVLNVVPGDGPEVGEPLGRHMDVDMVSFTGSTETGGGSCATRRSRTSRRSTLEMGGKNPCIVLDDAENLDRVAGPCGQRRVLEHGRELLRRLAADRAGGREGRASGAGAAHAREWPVGDPLDPETRVGALVSKAHFDKVCQLLWGRTLKS
jgi:gamma-glutamyl-gamma-aminobutyraldehyde dehydrogenase